MAQPSTPHEDDIEALIIQTCEESPDGTHCNHWWDCGPCCRCGSEYGGEDDCDCEKHTAAREARNETQPT